MIRRSLTVALTAAAILAVGGCASEHANLGSIRPTTTEPTRTASAAPSPTPSATASATTAAGQSTTGSTTNPDPARTTTQAAPPPAPDNTQACGLIGDALFVWTLDVNVEVMMVLEADPPATDDEKQQALQEYHAAVNTLGGQLRQGANQANDPSLKDAANTWADAMGRLAGAQDAPTIRAIASAPELFEATATIDQFCA